MTGTVTLPEAIGNTLVAFWDGLGDREPGTRPSSVLLKSRSVEFAGGVEVAFTDAGGAVIEGWSVPGAEVLLAGTSPGP
jgi:hypothetical protein